MERPVLTLPLASWLHGKASSIKYISLTPTPSPPPMASGKLEGMSTSFIVLYQVKDDYGNAKWKRVQVKLEDHIKIPTFPAGLKIF